MIPIAARYATDTFVVQLPNGASHLVIKGSLRDSTHPAVTANPGPWSTTPLPQASVGALLAAHLAAHPAGSEV